MNLIPEKGANKRKYQKRKRPDIAIDQDQCVTDRSIVETNEDLPSRNNGTIEIPHDDNADDDSDDEIPEIKIGFEVGKKKNSRKTSNM